MSHPTDEVGRGRAESFPGSLGQKEGDSSFRHGGWSVLKSLLQGSPLRHYIKYNRHSFKYPTELPR